MTTSCGAAEGISNVAVGVSGWNVANGVCMGVLVAVAVTGKVGVAAGFGARVPQAVVQPMLRKQARATESLERILEVMIVFLLGGRSASQFITPEHVPNRGVRG
jgi:hypothetical protein